MWVGAEIHVQIRVREECLEFSPDIFFKVRLRYKSSVVLDDLMQLLAETIQNHFKFFRSHKKSRMILLNTFHRELDFLERAHGSHGCLGGGHVGGVGDFLGDGCGTD